MTFLARYSIAFSFTVIQWMAMLDTIRNSWGWTGLEPAAVTASNAFGNIIVQSLDNGYWRICPEALSCELIACDDVGFQTLWANAEFQRDWQMTHVVEIAQEKLGQIDDEKCYCLMLPAVLGGKYDATNFGTNSRRELLALSGELARQLEDFPDGSKVSLRLTRKRG
jgi:hypothetical protein